MQERPFTRFDHVQLAMPKDGEELARAFYGDALGMSELPKPAELAAGGGLWFASGDLQLHLGVDPEFRPARKAHPALRCSNFEVLTGRLRALGIAVGVPEPFHDGSRHAYMHDPFGNRIELIAE
jgi:catechol 2,3-dioxygenase-like lactoylglutathione lyase family enzyme